MYEGHDYGWSNASLKESVTAEKSTSFDLGYEIYFDSLNFKDYSETINGISNRQKIRIRWYGDFFGLIKKPVLEFKQKKGILVKKITRPFPPFEIRPSTQLRTTLRNIYAKTKKNQINK